MCIMIKASLSFQTDKRPVSATYTEKMREVPRYAADIVSFAWAGVCSCVSAFVVCVFER